MCSFDTWLAPRADPWAARRREASLERVNASFLARPEFKADPYPFYARMREEAPVFRLSIPFPRRFWLLTRYDDIVAMLKDERLSRDLLAKLPWFPRFAPLFSCPSRGIGSETPA